MKIAVVGAATARALQREGYSVTLFDPAPPARGASFGNAGHIAIDHVRPLSRPDILARVPKMLADPLAPLAIRWRDLSGLVPWLLRFAVAARPAQVERGTAALAGLLDGAVAAWEEEVRGSNLAGLFRSRGALIAYDTDRGFAAAAVERAIQKRHGVLVETMDGDAARRLAPGLSPRIRHATFFPTAQHVVDPYALAAGLAEAFQREGGRIEPAAVTGFAPADGAVAAVLTATGRHACDAAVLAAGGESAALGRAAGVRLPLVAERGYHVMIEPKGARFEVPVTWGERGFVLTPMDTGIRLAGTVELAAADAPPSWRRAELLIRQARMLFPDLTGGETARWMGMRPTFPDYLPAIGLVPGRGRLVIACGHQHIGLTTATVTARIVAALLAGRRPPCDIAAFDPARFGRIG